MPVTATSYEALVVSYAIAMLAGSATFRTLVGAINETGAKARIIEWDGGTFGQAGGEGAAIACDGSAFTFASVPFAQVAADAWASDTTSALGWERRSGDVRIAIKMPSTPGDKPPEIMRRAANVLGAIRTEIQAQFGTTGKLASGSCSLTLSPLPDETGPHKALTLGIITISWRNS